MDELKEIVPQTEKFIKSTLDARKSGALTDLETLDRLVVITISALGNYAMRLEREKLN